MNDLLSFLTSASATWVTFIFFLSLVLDVYDDDDINADDDENQNIFMQNPKGILKLDVEVPNTVFRDSDSLKCEVNRFLTGITTEIDLDESPRNGSVLQVCMSASQEIQDDGNKSLTENAGNKVS